MQFKRKLKYLISYRKLYIYSYLIINLASVYLKLFGLKKSINFFHNLSKKFKTQKKIKDPVKHAWHIAFIANRVSKLTPLRTKCLETSITVWHILLIKKIKSELKIGTRFEGEVFKAHAWVEIENKVITDDPNNRYKYVPFKGDIHSFVLDK